MHHVLSSVIWTLFLANQKKVRKNFRLLSPNTLMPPASLVPLSMLDKIFQSFNQKHCTVLVAGVSPSKEDSSSCGASHFEGKN